MADRSPTFIGSAARLIRLQNGALAALGVVAGAWWTDRGAIGARTSFAAAAAFLLASFANAFNDVQDVEIDRVAHPERPIPSGAMSARQGLAIALASGAGALALSARASIELAVATAVVVAAMTLYSTHVKRAGVAGNLLVAVLASLPFAYGAWSAGNTAASVPLLAIAVPMHFAREVAKDLDDVAGDRARRHTLPLVRGLLAARYTVVGATVVGLVSLLPLMVRQASFALLVLPAVALAVVAVVRVVRGARGGPTLLKSAMIAATLSLLVIRS